MNRLIAALCIALLTSFQSAAIFAAGSGEAKLPIVLTLFLHDDLESSDIRNLDAGYLNWFTKDLEKITGRSVEIIYVRNKPGFTDFVYRLGDSEKAVYEWNERVIDYVIYENKPRDRRHKYLLITREDLTSSVSGSAQLGKRSAIASLTAYQTIAHEVGHTFGATHEDGEFRITAAPIPCITNMYIAKFFLKNCYLYSDQSAQVIRKYLQGTP